MNIKCLVATSVIALASASAVQAADVMMPREAQSVVTFTPTFSWTGFYLGGQIGNFSSKNDVHKRNVTDALKKEFTPKPSGFMGGIYAGSNVDLGNGFIFGVETDAVWADREDTKNVDSWTLASAAEANKLKQNFEDAKVTFDDDQAALFVADSTVADDLTLREKWSGATRVRLGFAVADRFMPYVAGGVAYTQLRGINHVTVTEKDKKANDKSTSVSGDLFDKTKMTVGYTLGAGFDFAMVDNVILRAEYRYSDFGKMKFAKDQYEVGYKTNDFRVGVAYKF
ncbi:outer membrane protein [Bartonella sp. CB60]|uniref:outer membrane protein n=1 Tax=Bartonella sp. CB60 TaxID=3113619 RepID=UPI00300DDDA8